MKNAGRVLILIVVFSFIAIKPIGLGASDFISCRDDSQAASCILVDCCLTEGSNTCACSGTSSSYTCNNWAGVTCADIGSDLPKDPPQT